jgi:putative endonuclease
MKKEIGESGEAFARSYLKRKGYRIIQTNYRTPLGEIDIIAKDGDTIVFVEVKTRKNLSFGYPHEAVTISKQKRLKRLALYYLKVNNLVDARGRFDVLSLVSGEGSYKVEHFEDAFEI